MPPKVIVVCGPTASGKTALGVALAQRLGGEVVSADSMQIYRRMDIGTAKPTAEEMGGIPHHMLDVADPGEDYSVARYVEAASTRVDDILSRGKRAILVGGTGLYIDSLLSGRTFAAFTGTWRDKLQKRAQAEGLSALREELRGIDPQRWEKLAASDEKRILRALEVWYETGETITAHDLRSQAQPPRYEGVTLALDFADRADQWRRIDQRVDEMMARGLAQEVQALLDSGVSPGCTAMQAIGYKELTAALRGEDTLESAAEQVKLRSRQYAKRQRSWFRRYPEAHWLLWGEIPDFSNALQNSTRVLAENGIS